ncbi:MerR family transcriptional regulator [Fodinicola feengrottensis]|uniref:MerR family transcriptional regulator n=1 Tax=Fodinicola feengrottensis TaxID=435914 RepID=UPI0013D1C750|nr:MerR family transcriptional regulator [Fodinicola feengrottensis]
MPDLTIDELAHQTGTKTSTLRLYQSKGLLDPPEVRGRVGYYSSAHVERLQAIGSLQRRGYSLAAIKELFDGHRRGAHLDELLGIAQGRPAAELDPARFLALFPDGEIDPAVITRAVDLGLMEVAPDGSSVRAPSPTFLEEVGLTLAEHGVPPAVALDEFEALTADVSRIADRYVALFARYVAGDRPAELTAAVTRFRALAGDAVREALERALDQAAARWAGE